MSEDWERKREGGSSYGKSDTNILKISFHFLRMAIIFHLNKMEEHEKNSLHSSCLNSDFRKELRSKISLSVNSTVKCTCSTLVILWMSSFHFFFFFYSIWLQFTLVLPSFLHPFISSFLQNLSRQRRPDVLIEVSYHLFLFPPPPSPISLYLSFPVRSNIQLTNVRRTKERKRAFAFRKRERGPPIWQRREQTTRFGS